MGIPESEKFLNVESGLLGFGIRNTAQGTRNPGHWRSESRIQAPLTKTGIGNWNPESMTRCITTWKVVVVWQQSSVTLRLYCTAIEKHYEKGKTKTHHSLTEPSWNIWNVPPLITFKMDRPGQNCDTREHEQKEGRNVSMFLNVISRERTVRIES